MSTDLYHITLPYRKTVKGDDVLIDVYPPPYITSAADTSVAPKIAALVYFHVGGIVVGNRKSFLPPWIMSRFSLNSVTESINSLINLVRSCSCCWLGFHICRLPPPHS